MLQSIVVKAFCIAGGHTMFFRRYPVTQPGELG